LSNEIRQIKPSNYFVAWPGWPALKVTLPLSVIFCLQFSLLYGSADYIAGLRGAHFSLYFDWELKIPFVVEMILVYDSLNLLLLLAPFILRDIRQFKLFFYLLVAETVIATVFFVLVPMQDSFSSIEVSGPLSTVFHYSDLFNLTYNEAPSLHVAFSVTAAIIYSRKRSALIKLILILCSMLLAISTLLTHQHHLIGVVCGFILAFITILMMEKLVENRKFTIT